MGMGRWFVLSGLSGVYGFKGSALMVGALRVVFSNNSYFVLHLLVLLSE